MSLRSWFIVSLVQFLILAAPGAYQLNAEEQTYVVKKNETLSAIADHFGVHITLLAEHNNLEDTDIIYAGQELIIPDTSAGTPDSGDTYVVKGGDSLVEIAGQFGVTVDALVQANVLAEPNTIFPGQELAIPADSEAGSRPYTVRNGDTLEIIAQEFGIDVEDIVTSNNLDNPNRIFTGQVLQIPGGASETEAPAEYIVQKGDFLESIAAKFGTSAFAIAAENQIAEPDKIFVGQRLVIPSNGAYTQSTEALPHSIKQKLDKTDGQSGRWKNIVIHHSATTLDTPVTMDRYHHQRGMENGLAYHFVIGNGRRTGNGKIYVGHRWNKQLDGGHVASYELNKVSLGICLIGNFNKTRPSEKQMQSLKTLVRYLMKRCNIPKSRVKPHRMINATECPGDNFPYRRFLEEL
ncbi:MAG: LysM peptidoglycan-binding domain-containing protein [Verrucomicrobia bacterium]|nr:LysM peptidoglycan-binding domain-containing protein [Verrucomicrobiota bacterium]MCF7708232.1 LysM peptidoglycan-binding domain-containing protein [Verrucomicrobiota bacterium]